MGSLRQADRHPHMPPVLPVEVEAAVKFRAAAAGGCVADSGTEDISRRDRRDCRDAVPACRRRAHRHPNHSCSSSRSVAFPPPDPNTRLPRTSALTPGVVGFVFLPDQLVAWPGGGAGALAVRVSGLVLPDLRLRSHPSAAPPSGPRGERSTKRCRSREGSRTVSRRAAGDGESRRDAMAIDPWRQIPGRCEVSADVFTDRIRTLSRFSFGAESGMPSCVGRFRLG